MQSLAKASSQFATIVILGKDIVHNTLMIMKMITMVILAIIILEVVVLISG